MAAREPLPLPPITPQNPTLFQAFEWYCPADHQHWQRLARILPDLKDQLGIDLVWLPPGCKASSPQGNGYDVYDLWDLGEFEQKGGRATKWGAREDLMALVQRAEDVGVGLMWDAVLNHKAAADFKEKCMAVEVDAKDRTKDVSPPHEIDAWVGFDFPGRKGAHSAMTYGHEHFTGTDYDAHTGKVSIFRILSEDGAKNWSQAVDVTELGNYDYLMFADVCFEHPEVVADVKRWVEWMGRETRVRGVRFDAIKHFSDEFLKELVGHLNRTVGEGWFLVGEYWKDSSQVLEGFLERMQHRFSLFDVPLVLNFEEISQSRNGDLTRVFLDSLVESMPENAVTFVMNHDTQPHQSLEAPIAPFFKPLAYALILLRAAGHPCVFYGDLYGMQGPSPAGPSCAGKLPDLCIARKLWAYGEQNDYFDDPHCVGWTREGTWDRPWGLACVLSNRGRGEKMMYVGERHAGEVWTDIWRWEDGGVVIDGFGNGVFGCPGRAVAIFVRQDAEGRERLGGFDVDIYQGTLGPLDRGCAQS